MQGERFFFRTTWRDDAQSLAQSAYMRSVLRTETAFLIDDGEPFGRTLADAFSAAFEAEGGQVISRERIERGTTDFTSLARQISAANPDAVVFDGFDPEGALFVDALRTEGYGGAFVGPDSLLSVRDFVGTASEAAEGAIVTGGPVPDETFIERFDARFGRRPSTSFVLQAYDAARIALTSIESVGEDMDGSLTIDREALADALRSQSFAGLTGGIRFDENGDRTGETAAELGLAIYRVNGGVFELVQ
jgi:branched-chain amino acid transport system substrate-binding protein